MFLEIFLFEIKYRLKKISTWVYFGIFFALTFILIAGYGGAFKGLNVSVGSSGGNVKANSPYLLYMIISTFGYFGMLITSAIMGSSIYKDFSVNCHSLFFTKPISKFNYFFGRFFGSMTVVLIIFLSFILGAFIAAIMPFMSADKLGDFHLMYYLHPYLTAVVPVVFLTGTIFFSMAAISRKIMPTYVSGVIILIGYLIASNFLSDIDNKTIAALVDPFGMGASTLVTKYWTVAEKNSMLVSLQGLLLLNRCLWSFVGFVVLLFSYFKFDLSFVTKSTGKMKKVKEEKREQEEEIVLTKPKVFCIYSFKNSLFHAARLTLMEFKGILNNIYFIVIMLAGILFLFSTSSQVGKMFGTTTYPVTYMVLSIISGSFALFVLIIITFYAGELVWREREIKIDQLMDSLPVPTPVFYISKLTALIMVQVLILVIIMICGVIIQSYKGYYNYDFTLYFKILFGQELLAYSMLCVFAIFVQVLSPHKFFGHFVMIVYYIGNTMLSMFGFNHHLYRLFTHPTVIYSDMNGFGHFIKPFIYFNIYWVSFVIFIALISNLLWVRGKETNLIVRVRQMFVQATKANYVFGTLVLIVFVVSGSFIFYNTNILNKYKTNKKSEEEFVNFEKKYSKYKNLVQPRIISVKTDVDIFPKERNFSVKGNYILENKTEKIIENIHVLVNPDMKINKLGFNIKTEQTLIDKKNGYYIYKLSKQLMPGEFVNLEFDLDYVTKGFKNSGTNTSIVYNGTFFDNMSYFPHIGYDESYELSDNEDRKKYGLKSKPRMADVNDMEARKNTYISHDADWVDFETTVSTTKDQIAIAPGYLQKQWVEGNRKYFHYKMNSKILNFYSFLSAKYLVKHDKWNDVAIDIYYNKGHEYNLDRMINAIKKALAYYSKNFSPYQHKQIRILEFPRYATFAQSFPNTIPFSESIGFIAKVDDNDEDDLDYPFYVTAHEVAHQWWAHQVIGGNVQGSTLMSESLAQYSALMVMKKQFGREKMRKFLKFELDKYLSGRSFERKKELPLYKVENQSYIHYRKGSVVMYALQDYIGEENVNKALSNYIKKVGFQEPPYTNSIEFLDCLKEVTPEKYQYLIKDMFETITIFENRVSKAVSKKLESGKYEITISTIAKKYRADELGNEKEIAIDDWIDIGVLGKDSKELYLKKYKIDKKEMEITVVVDEKPEKAGIDIYNKLIDRISGDNVLSVVFNEK